MELLIIMPPFVRVKIVKTEPGPSFVQNGDAFDPFVAVNVKECLMQPGNMTIYKLMANVSNCLVALHDTSG